MKLEDILDGKYIFSKKVGSKDRWDIYVYPPNELTEIDSTNIMVIGETGVGKSTKLHCFINYLKGIHIKENNKYYLFDEKTSREYEKKTHNKILKGCSIKNNYRIYNIESYDEFNNPIRLIDTVGFCDIRGLLYKEKIIKDIQDLFTYEI